MCAQIVNFVSDSYTLYLHEVSGGLYRTSDHRQAFACLLSCHIVGIDVDIAVLCPTEMEDWPRFKANDGLHTERAQGRPCCPQRRA